MKTKFVEIAKKIFDFKGLKAEIDKTPENMYNFLKQDLTKSAFATMGAGSAIAGSGMLDMNPAMVIGGLGAAATAVVVSQVSKKVRELEAFREKYGLTGGLKDEPVQTAPRNDFKDKGTSLDL